jgi:hypothetical protein
VPLAPRHPTRHSIWTPVLDRIQETLYTPNKLRLDGTRLYVSNAVERQATGEPDWNFKGAALLGQIATYGGLLHENQPLMVLAFGRRAYAFARLALGHMENCRPTDWTTKTLGEEFRQRVIYFDRSRINLFPMLHASIARRYWWKSHREFTGNDDGNYFEFTGMALGNLLKEHAAELDIWVNTDN